jgi:hypothetical protein
MQFRLNELRNVSYCSVCGDYCRVTAVLMKIIVELLLLLWWLLSSYCSAYEDYCRVTAVIMEIIVFRVVSSWSWRLKPEDEDCMLLRNVDIFNVR